MRHTEKDPTQLKTSKSQHDHLNENHTSTRRHLTLCYVDTQHSLYVCLLVCLIVCLVRLDLSIRLFVNLFVCPSNCPSVCLPAIVTESACRSLEEKKGKGILNRVYHWMEAKSIRPLSALAEVDTLEGSCTLSGHFFANCGVVGKVLVKKLACLNCGNCRQHNYHQCGNTAMCGALLEKPVKLKSKARDSAPITRECEQLKAAGRARAAKVKEGMLIGSECDDDREPCIVSLALSEPKVWNGVSDRSWMGRIEEGIMSAKSCDWFPLPNQKCVEFTCVAIQFQLLIINTVSVAMQFQF